MKLLRARWYDIGVIRAIAALMNFVVILWHQFEEYHFPGGEPALPTWQCS